jgi:hypothetical protein
MSVTELESAISGPSTEIMPRQDQVMCGLSQGHATREPLKSRVTYGSPSQLQAQLRAVSLGRSQNRYGRGDEHRNISLC